MPRAHLPPPSPQVRRRRTVVLVSLAAVAVAGVTLFGRGSPPRTGRPGGPGSPAGFASTAPGPTAGTSTPATAPRATTTSRAPGPTVVATTTLNVDDAGRRFPVVVYYPAVRSGVDATPQRRGAPWPLIVFSPGFDIDPTAYSAMLQHWAGAGFVVAEAYYPFTAAGAAGGVNESDIVHHPADLKAVIDTLLSPPDPAGGTLRGMIDPARIGVAGHSDGGDVTDAVVADTCCQDKRIRAAAVLSGAELSSFGGTYVPAGVPLLVVQGDADQINPPGCSQQIYDVATTPRFYLDLRGAGHRAPYLDTGPYDASAVPPPVYQADVDRATTLFWESYLYGRASDSALLSAGTGLGPEAALTAGAPLAITGDCPGAPPS